ncbi:MAG: tryptophan synthase subunit alpha [Firmicutes bacterium]|nr:tryptophan synthase subunit alpha [Bacillota bacterium]
MEFDVIYYICIACPTIERTLEMVDQYVAHGARAFQIDMPSKDPFAETDFVKEMMKNSLMNGYDYDHYMDGIREIRRRHPGIDLHVVVYNDVVDAIGVDRFIAFGKEVQVRSFMIPGASTENFERIESGGIKVFRTIPHELPEDRILHAIAGGKDCFISLRNKKPGEVDVPGYETWPKKYAYIRSRGVQGDIYSVFGIKTKEQLLEVRETGGRGAIIGNVLMRLWDDEKKLWELMESFQSVAR